MKSAFTLSVASVLAIAMGVSPLATAQPPTKYYPEGTVPTPIEIARTLAGPGFVPKIKLRGLAVPAAAASTPAEFVAAVSTPSTEFPASRATVTTPYASPAASSGVLAIAIPFAFDSARLAPTAAPALDNVAEGFKLLGNNAKIVIEGHTDAAGSAQYNLRLSKQRAQSVKRYLVKNHGLSPRVLVTAGKGQSEPLSGLEKTSKENRRVQFRLG